MSFWPTDTAGRIADVCSGLGLALTAVLTTSALVVKRRFEKIVLYPQHVQKLDAHCKVLNKLAGSYPASQHEAGMQVAKLKGDLNSLQPYLTGMPKQTLQRVIASIDAYRTQPDESMLRQLLGNMYQLFTEMQNLSERLIF